jgi:AcrR family transcriptional regulator
VTENDRSPRIAQIVGVARGLLETEGPGGLTMRSVADRLGIQAPSLYKHLDDKEELEALLQAEALRGMGDALREALQALSGRAGTRRRVEALGQAYRSWAHAHPHLYRLATGGPLARDRLPAGLEAWAAEPLLAVAGDQDRARAIWAFAHGMTILELDGRFPAGADLDAAWARGVAALG